MWDSPALHQDSLLLQEPRCTGATPAQFLEVVPEVRPLLMIDVREAREAGLLASASATSAEVAAVSTTAPSSGPRGEERPDHPNRMTASNNGLHDSQPQR